MAQPSGPEVPLMGNLLRLAPLHFEELPEHATLRQGTSNTNPSPTVQAPTLRDFIHRALAEAEDFTGNAVPRLFVSKGEKKSPPSVNHVEVISHTFTEEETNRVNYDDTRLPRWKSGPGRKPAEHWFGRRSRHANHSDEGTANWSEFDRCLREDHSEFEKKYTPAVYDNYEVLNWNDAIVSELGGEVQTTAGKYTDIQMALVEMCHQLPPPMAPRSFSEVVLTAKGPRKNSLLVVQLPVDIADLNAARYSNRRNIEKNEKKGQPYVKKTQTVRGIYTSVERCQILPDLNIEWLMVTASDAKGMLPMWMQKMALPGAVAKDVGFFMKFIGKDRRERSAEHVPAHSRQTSDG